MASHTDDLYSSLLKIGEFIEQRAAEFDERGWPPDDTFWRLWFWQGVLVVAGDLLVVAEDDGQLGVTEIEEAPLVFNFHFGEQPRTVLIEIVRERAFMEYTDRIIAEDRRLAKLIHEVRTGASASTS